MFQIRQDLKKTKKKDILNWSLFLLLVIYYKAYEPLNEEGYKPMV